MLWAKPSEVLVGRLPTELGAAPKALVVLDLLEHFWRCLLAASLAIHLALLARVTVRRKFEDATREHGSRGAQTGIVELKWPSKAY